MNGHACLAALLLLGTPPAMAAQGSTPLRKTDLVQLLSNPLFQRSEIAVVVRRNCLAFQPTQRDWSDLRRLGADADVMGSLGECVARGGPAAPATAATPGGPRPEAALVATYLTPRLAASVGTQAAVQIQIRRADGAPARQVALSLRITPRAADGPPAEAHAISDDSGFVVFSLPAGRRAGRYRLQLVNGQGTSLPGKPVIDLDVGPGAPAAAEAQPPRLELGPPGQTSFGLLVTVRDSFGNAVPHEQVELRPANAAMGLLPDTASTDSLGRVSFVLRRSAVREPGQLHVRVRGMTLASVGAVLMGPPPPTAPPRTETAPLPDLKADFAASPTRRGPAGTRLADELTVRLRSRSGAPIAGRFVSFRAANAQVEPDSAATDSAGHVQVQVTLGTKAGIAVVTAVLDSVRTQDTLVVEPDSAVELILERDGERVDGKHILVELGVPFQLTLRARDRYGNTIPTASLAGRLQELRRSFNTRLDHGVELLAAQPEGGVTVLMFKPVRLGSTNVRIHLGLAAMVWVEVLPPPR